LLSSGFIGKNPGVFLPESGQFSFCQTVAFGLKEEKTVVAGIKYRFLKREFLDLFPVQGLAPGQNFGHFNAAGRLFLHGGKFSKTICKTMGLGMNCFKIVMAFQSTLARENRERMPEPQFLTLENIERDCWDLLLQGSLKGRDGFHTFALGTRKGEDVDMRTLVLRKVEKSERRIFTHTDARSPKVDQIESGASAGLLFYDPVRKIQIRIKARAFMHREDHIAISMWDETRLSARKSYLSLKSPGHLLGQGEDGLPEHLKGRDPDMEESLAGLPNFLVLGFEVIRMDWLYLHSQGHRRAVFEYNEAGYDAFWINP
jgi:hypothetical protein